LNIDGNTYDSYFDESPMEFSVQLRKSYGGVNAIFSMSADYAMIRRRLFFRACMMLFDQEEIFTAKLVISHYRISAHALIAAQLAVNPMGESNKSVVIGFYTNNALNKQTPDGIKFFILTMVPAMIQNESSQIVEDFDEEKENNEYPVCFEEMKIKKKKNAICKDSRHAICKLCMKMWKESPLGETCPICRERKSRHEPRPSRSTKGNDGQSTY